MHMLIICKFNENQMKDKQVIDGATLHIAFKASNSAEKKNLI